MPCSAASAKTARGVGWAGGIRCAADDGQTGTDESGSLAGNDELVGLIRELYPMRGRRTRATRPLICVIRQEDTPPVLGSIRRTFGRAGLVVHLQRPVEPTTQADHPPPERGSQPPITQLDVELVRTLLTELTELMGRVGDRRRRLRRFRRFALTVWLMRQRLDDNAGDQESLERQIRELLRNQRSSSQGQIPDELPGWLGMLAILLPFVWFRARVSGRLPVLSGHYRWFVRRESLAPPVSGGITAATSCCGRVTMCAARPSWRTRC
jgi:hypothetical protein